MSFKFTRNKYTKFFDQSRKRRKLSFIKLKNKIGRFPDRLFYTPHFVDERDDGFFEEYRMHQWIDVYFISKKKANVFYSASFVTKSLKLWDLIEEEGYQYAENVLTKEQKDQSNDRSFIPDEHNPKYTIMIHNHPEMRDLYHNTWERRVAEKACEKDVHLVDPKNEMKFNHTYGIKLHITLPLDVFTGKDVTAWIEHFYANGEQLDDVGLMEVKTETLFNLGYLKEKDKELLK